MNLEREEFRGAKYIAMAGVVRRAMGTFSRPSLVPKLPISLYTYTDLPLPAMLAIPFCRMSRGGNAGESLLYRYPTRWEG